MSPEAVTIRRTQSRKANQARVEKRAKRMEEVKAQLRSRHSTGRLPGWGRVAEEFKLPKAMAKELCRAFYAERDAASKVA